MWGVAILAWGRCLLLFKGLCLGKRRGERFSFVFVAKVVIEARLRDSDEFANFFNGVVFLFVKFPSKGCFRWIKKSGAAAKSSS